MRTSSKHPVPTVDIVIAQPGKGVALVQRRFEPLGWALPGGFVDYGETVEAAAVREALEETQLTVRLQEILGVYSDPARDKRMHTISTVFIANTDEAEQIRGGDDATAAAFFPLSELPGLAFDHAAILDDFARKFAKRYGL
jgi:8-oxo-dGTP diphosphatase